MKDIKYYLEQTNTVILTKDAFEYLKKRASVLDKIRAEIEEQKKERCFDDNDMFAYKTGLDDAIWIIDKYKAESEDEDVEYQRQIEQLEHDILYEPTFNPEDGSM